MNTSTFDFAITHKDDESVALKHLSIPSDSQEIANSFADEALDEFRAGLVIKPEEFEEKTP